MQTPQTVVIIGAGEKGKGIAYGLSGGNYRILLCDHDTSAVETFIEGIRRENPSVEIETSSCSYDATWEADMIVLTVTPADLEAVTKNIRVVACQKVVIVSANATQVQQLLPNAKVVEAFSGITVGSFYEPSQVKQTIDCEVRGEDPEAVEMVRELVSTIGFAPVISTTTETNNS